MEIIDAQIHSPLPLKPWDAINAEQALEAEVEMSVSAMEAVGVDRAVTYSEEDFCRVAHTRYPEKFVGVLSFRDPTPIDRPDEYMAELGARADLVGIRVLAGMGESWRLLSEGTWEPTLAAAERYQVPVVFWIPQHLPLLKEVATKHPDLRVIVDHLGMQTPPTTPLSDSVFDKLPELLALAALPNVAVKFSGAPALSPEPYPFAALWPRLRKIIDAYGPERLMWGTDYTRVTGRHRHPRDPGGRLSYGELVDFLRYTSEVTEADKAIMFNGAIRKWFGWPDAAKLADAAHASRSTT